MTFPFVSSCGTAPALFTHVPRSPANRRHWIPSHPSLIPLRIPRVVLATSWVFIFHPPKLLLLKKSHSYAFNPHPRWEQQLARAEREALAATPIFLGWDDWRSRGWLQHRARGCCRPAGACCPASSGQRKQKRISKATRRQLARLRGAGGLRRSEQGARRWLLRGVWGGSSEVPQPMGGRAPAPLRGGSRGTAAPARGAQGVRAGRQHTP